MATRTPKDLIECRNFFLDPESPKHRMYEALRAYYVENRSSPETAKTFGYTPGSFRVLCHQFRHDPEPVFFIKGLPGPRSQPKKTAARDLIVQLRKQNRSIYEISEALKEQKLGLSPTAVGEVLKEEGFAPLPRRVEEERSRRLGPRIEAVADVRSLSLVPRTITTVCGGLFLFIPDLIRLGVDKLAKAAQLAGSQMIPAEHALRACLALKLFCVERKSHVMSVVADEGLALFAGLNVIPKKSYFSEYSSKIHPARNDRLLAAWHQLVQDQQLFTGQSFNLDFHSVPYYGDDPILERHYVSARSRRQPSILAFLAQDAEGRAFCYSNADIRKGEEPEEIFRFIAFWKRTHGQNPEHLVFDSRLTTYANLARLHKMRITFITLRRRSPRILQEIAALPRSAWRTIELDVPTRKYKTPRIHEVSVDLAGETFRQIYIKDLGHDEPTLLLTNDRNTVATKLITRYAQRMLIENALSDAVRFFHMDALSSAVGLKVDFDMTLLVIASGLYRLMAKRMRGYADAQARSLFRDLVDTPATVTVGDTEVVVTFQPRAHLPIILASGLIDKPVSVPWWNGRKLRLTAVAQTASR